MGASPCESKKPRTDKDGNVIPTDPQAIRAAEEGLKAAKDKRNHAINEYHDKFGDQKTARRIEQIGADAYAKAHAKAKAQGKSDEEAEKEAETARLNAQDAALGALGEKAANVEKLMRAGGGSGKASQEKTKGTEGGTTAGGVAQLTTELDKVGTMMVSAVKEEGEQGHRDFAALNYKQQHLLIVERKELRTAEHMSRIAKEMPPERLAQHLTEMPTHILAEEGVLRGVAPHLTAESYTPMRERLEQEGKGSILMRLHAEMKEAGKDQLRLDYNRSHSE